MNHKQDRQDMGLLMPRQQGVVLLVMLALLFIATLLGIAMVVSTTGETRMASLRSQREFSHTLAEAGASAVALKALNDLDPNQTLQNKTWDCTALGWQGGMGSTTSQTQPGACTIALEAQGGSYSGWLKISAGSSDTMANQLRAQAAVVPLLSGIGPIIGAPGRAGFVVAAATVSPDPGAATDPSGAAQASWLDRKGGWYWPVAASAGGGQSPAGGSAPTTTTQPFALKAIPTPSTLPAQPWTTYSWTDYKRGLNSDAVTGLKVSGGIVDGTTKSDSVSQRYQRLKDAYKQWEDTGSQYDISKSAALAVAVVLDAAGTIQQAVGLAGNLAGVAAGTATAGTGTVVTSGASTAVSQVSNMASDAAMQTLLDQMNSAGQAHIDAAVAVIEARQAIRKPWGSLDTLHQAENGIEAVWSCGSDGTNREYTTEMDMTDADFQTKTASRMPVISNEALSSAANSVSGITQNIGIGKNVTEVTDAANTLQSTAQGQSASSNGGSGGTANGGGNSGGTGGGGGGASGGNTQLPGGGGSSSAPSGDTDPIGTAMSHGPGGADTSTEKEPRFMLVDTKPASLTGISTGDGYVQTNPMCNADAELMIQAQSGTSSGSGSSPSSAPAAPCQPGQSVNSQNSNDRACNNPGSNSDHGNNGEGNPPGQTDNANNAGNGNTQTPSGTTGSSGMVAIQEATIVHTGAITFKAEAPLQNGKVADILVSKGKITVDSDQQGQSGPAGVVLWSDKDIYINRPVSGAAVAGDTVTVTPQGQNGGMTQDTTMLTYNPAVDPGLLGNGKFPLAGYTLGSWTSLASTP